ncbi:MAG: proton-conducting transporter membrane subunit [Desulfurococcaceae archaeon]
MIIELLELGLMPFICLFVAIMVPLLNRFALGRRINPYLATFCSALLPLLALRVHLVVHEHGAVTYRFGGFPPPIGVVYIVDEVSSTLALLASFVLFACILYSTWIIDRDRLYLFHSLAFLLAMGVYGCLYTGDLFNFYVSVELVAVASYALTTFNSEKGRAVKAAFIYGVFGTVMTSTYFLAVLIIYGSYGTLNMADVGVKACSPHTITSFSSGIYGDITLTTKISMALITWVLFFKSGIMPNHFWLPEVYRYAPLPAVVLFSAAADMLGVYGLIRLYYTIFTEESIVGGFRASMISIMLILGAISTVFASTVVMRQRNLRSLVAYSSIVQYSLALLGMTTGVPEGIAGAILHLATNALGDMLVLFSAGLLLSASHIVTNKVMRLLMYASFITGLLNLFGVIPILPGFWSKAFLTLGFMKANIPVGVVVVLASSGLCALGYFTLIMLLLSKRPEGIALARGQRSRSYVPVVVVVITQIATIGLGLALTLGGFRDLVLSYGRSVFDRSKFLEVLP